MLFMNLEQRPVQFEDIARQVLNRGKREQAKYYFDQIESVQEGDIQRVADQILCSEVAVAAMGNLNNNDPYNIIRNLINLKSAK